MREANADRMLLIVPCHKTSNFLDHRPSETPVPLHQIGQTSGGMDANLRAWMPQPVDTLGQRGLKIPV